MPDNRINGVLGAVRLSAAFQDLYTPDDTGDGKQAAGVVMISSWDKLNTRYFDITASDVAGGAEDDDFFYNVHQPVVYGNTELRPLSLKDGQRVKVRMDALPAAMTISGATTATPVVVTVDDTSTLHANDLVAISGVVAMTDINRRFKCTVIDATTFSLQDLSGVDFGSAQTYGSAGTAQKQVGDAIFVAYEETIPQETA